MELSVWKNASDVHVREKGKKGERKTGGGEGHLALWSKSIRAAYLLSGNGGQVEGGG